jgi:hypothetical protein
MTLRILAITLMLSFSACTPIGPRVSLAPGASLKGYRVFVVRPVTDETGARFDLDVKDSLRQWVVRRLQSHGLTAVTDAPADTAAPALVITSALVSFRGMPLYLQVPSPGVTGCEVHSELRDYRTGQRIGEIVAAELEEALTPMMVLIQCARDVADGIHRRSGR